MSWKTKTGVLIASAALLATGCGSGQSARPASAGATGGNGSTGTAAGAAKLTGAPVKLGVLGDLTVAGTDSHPDAWKAAQIAAAAVNASGGIKGRPLQLIVCDSKQDAQIALLCGEQLIIQDKVVAMVGSFDTEENGGLYPALNQANTVNFGQYPSNPQDFTSPRSFPLLPAPLPFLGMSHIVSATAKKVAIPYGQSAPSTAIVKQIEKTLPAGTKSVEIPVPPSGVVDMSPYCLKLQQSKADAVINMMSSSVVDQFETTCKEKGVTGQQWNLGDLGMDSETVKLFADAKPSPKVLMTFAGPAMTEMQQQLAIYGTKFGNPDPTNAIAKNSWLAVTVAAEILKKLPTISGPAFYSYLKQQTALSTGATPLLNFAKPGADKSFPRVVNTFAAPGKLQNGTVVQTGPFINLAS